MSQIIKKLPLPVTGLILGLAATGNLVLSYGSVYRNIFGGISAILFILILLKIIMYPKAVKENLENPAIASVFLTYPMAAMLLSAYLKPYFSSLAFGLWIVGIIVHIILMLDFANKFIKNFNIKKVFPSWFIVYVGIVVASVSAPAFGMESIGKAMFWFGLISYICLMPIILKRVFVVKEIPEPVLPAIAIFSAPASLLLAGYMSSFADKNMVLVWALLAISQITYFLVLLYMPKLLKLQFYPSYSGFTFPLVISAISLKLTNGFLTKSGNPVQILNALVKLEELIAVLIVVYVLIKYMAFIFAKESQPSTK